MAQWDNLASYLDDVNDIAGQVARKSVAPVVRWSNRVFDPTDVRWTDQIATPDESPFGPNTQEVLQFEDFIRNASPEALAIVGRTPSATLRTRNLNTPNIYVPRLQTFQSGLFNTSDENIGRGSSLNEMINEYSGARDIGQTDELRAGAALRDAMSERLGYEGSLPIILGDTSKYGTAASMSARNAGRAIAGRGRIPMGEQDYGWFTNPWLTGLLSDQAAVSRGKDFRSGLLSLSELGMGNANPGLIREAMLPPTYVLAYGDRTPDLNPDMVSSAASWLTGNSIPVTSKTMMARLVDMQKHGGTKYSTSDYDTILSDVVKSKQKVKSIKSQADSQKGLEGLLTSAEVKGLDYLSPEERGLFISKALQERAQGLR